MNRNQKIILAILAVLLAVVWFRALSPVHAGRTSSPVRPAPAAPRPAAAPLTEVPETWGENPFLSDRGSRTAASSGGISSPESSLVLNGILWDPKTPSAILNNQLGVHGDPVGVWKVVEIQKDRVVLSDGSQTKVLKPSD